MRSVAAHLLQQFSEAEGDSPPLSVSEHSLHKAGAFATVGSRAVRTDGLGLHASGKAPVELPFADGPPVGLSSTPERRRWATVAGLGDLARSSTRAPHAAAEAALSALHPASALLALEDSALEAGGKLSRPPRSETDVGGSSMDSNWNAVETALLGLHSDSSQSDGLGSAGRSHSSHSDGLGGPQSDGTPSPKASPEVGRLMPRISERRAADADGTTGPPPSASPMHASPMHASPMASVEMGLDAAEALLAELSTLQSSDSLPVLSDATTPASSASGARRPTRSPVPAADESEAVYLSLVPPPLAILSFAPSAAVPSPGGGYSVAELKREIVEQVMAEDFEKVAELKRTIVALTTADAPSEAAAAARRPSAYGPDVPSAIDAPYVHADTPVRFRPGGESPRSADLGALPAGAPLERLRRHSADAALQRSPRSGASHRSSPRAQPQAQATAFAPAASREDATAAFAPSAAMDATAGADENEAIYLSLTRPTRRADDAADAADADAADESEAVYLPILPRSAAGADLADGSGATSPATSHAGSSSVSGTPMGARSLAASAAPSSVVSSSRQSPRASPLTVLTDGSTPGSARESPRSSPRGSRRASKEPYDAEGRYESHSLPGSFKKRSPRGLPDAGRSPRAGSLSPRGSGSTTPVHGSERGGECSPVSGAPVPSLEMPAGPADAAGGTSKPPALKGKRSFGSSAREGKRSFGSSARSTSSTASSNSSSTSGGGTQRGGKEGKEGKGGTPRAKKTTPERQRPLGGAFGASGTSAAAKGALAKDGKKVNPFAAKAKAAKGPAEAKVAGKADGAAGATAASSVGAEGEVHDVRCSKIMSRLLRHDAQKVGVAIDSDGWVSMSELVHYLNHGPSCDDGGAYRKAAGAEAEARTYTADSVREVIMLNDAKRFEHRSITISGVDDEQVRACDGHTMKIVTAKLGRLLVLDGQVVEGDQDTTPAVHWAVHGTFPAALDGPTGVIKRGLHRMKRNFVSLCKEFGEEEHASEMPRNCAVFIWVDVHRAIREGRISFYEAANGVLQTSGDDEGYLPAQFISVVIQLRDGLANGSTKKKKAQLAVIERLYSGASAIQVSKLHGGFSGSLVLHVDSQTNGQPNEPTVLKLDSGAFAPRRPPIPPCLPPLLPLASPHPSHPSPQSPRAQRFSRLRRSSAPSVSPSWWAPRPSAACAGPCT